MSPEPRVTSLLYLEDGYLREFESQVVARVSGWVELSATAFYAGGGGQPPDAGQLVADGVPYLVTALRNDDDGAVWHQVGADLSTGAHVHGQIDWARRYALMRHHTLLHIVNALVFTHHHGLITGVQIGEQVSRIDFNVAGFERDQIPRLEAAINEVIVTNAAITARLINRAEYERRPALRRTLTVMPPVHDDGVRIVEIGGFDAQACGGTHVHNTRELGTARITRFDNKGRNNKRFYLELSAAAE